MSKERFDVVVVGSGAGGATAAFVLTQKGMRVCLLEAGRMLTPAKDFMTHTWPWELPFRGEGKPGEYFSCEDLAPAPVAAFFSAGVPASRSHQPV